MALLKKKYIVILFILLVIAAVSLFKVGEKQLERFAADSLKELALGKDKKGYFVNFRKFTIEWTNSRIEATGISIIPHMNQEKKSWVNGTVDTLVIDFSNIIFYAINKNITIENFTVINANFQYFWKKSEKKTAKKHNPIPKFDALRKRLSSIGIHSISIINTEFNGYYVTENYRHHHVFHTTQDFIIKGLEFNFDSTENKKKVVALEEFRFACGPTFMKGFGDLYQYKFDSLLISNKRDFFKVKGVLLSPQYDVDAFFKKVGKQTDRFVLSIQSLQGNGLKESDLFNQDIYHLENITIDHLSTEIYRDKNYTEDTTKHKALPHTALKALDFKLAIDSLSLTNSQLVYKEKSVDANKPGQLPLTNINAQIINLSNGPEDKIHLDLAFDFLDKGPTSVNIDLLLDKNSPHFMIAKGHFGAFPLSSLNQFTQNNAGIVFQKGKVNSIDFDVALADSIGRGDLDLYYQDLKIKITGKNDNKASFVESLAGFAANNVVHRSNSKDKKPRHAPLYYQRVKYKSVIHFLIHTLLSGAQTSVLGTYGQLPDEEKKEVKKKKRKSKKKKTTHQ